MHFFDQFFNLLKLFMIFFERIGLALFEIYPHIMDKIEKACRHQIHLVFRHS